MSRRGIAGTATRLARTMGQGPLTDEQRAAVLAFRAADRTLEDAKRAVREALDEQNRALGRLRRSGMTLRRIIEVLALPPTNYMTIHRRADCGLDLLGEPDDE